MCVSDTEGSFVVERVAEVATAAVQHIASVAEKSEDSGKNCCCSLSYFFLCYSSLSSITLLPLKLLYRGVAKEEVSNATYMCIEFLTL